MEGNKPPGATAGVAELDGMLSAGGEALAGISATSGVDAGALNGETAGTLGYCVGASSGALVAGEMCPDDEDFAGECTGVTGGDEECEGDLAGGIWLEDGAFAGECTGVAAGDEECGGDLAGGMCSENGDFDGGCTGVAAGDEECEGDSAGDGAGDFDGCAGKTIGIGGAGAGESLGDWELARKIDKNKINITMKENFCIVGIIF